MGDKTVARADNRIAFKMNKTLLELLEGDITELDVDAIVNAANEHLQLGTGVAGAIRRRAASPSSEECTRIGEHAGGHRGDDHAPASSRPSR